MPSCLNVVWYIYSMFRMLDKAFAVIAMAFGALLVCLIAFPLWTIGIFTFLYLLGRHLQELEVEAASLRDVSMLTPREYEQRCAALLQQGGWRATTTPINDQGADVIGTLNGYKVVVQCKKYANRVGNAAVQQIAAAKLHYKADIAVVVCLNGYTRSADELAKSCGVYLLHHDQLRHLQRIARVPLPV
jgi:HJR/Mrr/RecB family endonuclease